MNIKNMWVSMNNMGEVTRYGFQTQQVAIDYVKAHKEQHLHSHQVKETQDCDLWSCFTREEELCDGCHVEPCVCEELAIENGDVETLSNMGYGEGSIQLLLAEQP